MPPWMIYGANGYQGNLIAHEAKRRGLTPILAGRHAQPITRLGTELGLETRVFALTDPTAVRRALDGMVAVLHCAGPFSATSQPMLSGCLGAGAHYLDLTGEIAVLEALFGRAEEIRRAGIVALPGVGFDVVPSDCLAALLKRELPDATHLRLAFAPRFGRLSPGTARTTVEGVAGGTRARRDGQIVEVPPATEQIRFADQPRLAVRLSWGDVATAYYSTGIPNIEVFIGASPAQARQLRPPRIMRWALGSQLARALVKGMIRRAVKGPTEAERGQDEMRLWGEVTNAAGRRVVMRMRTPEGYTLTTASSLACVTALLERGLAPGAYTPSLAFGPEFALGLEGVSTPEAASD